MALLPISTAAFPNLPNAPGVPPIIRQIGGITNTITLLLADVRKVINAFTGKPQWGLFFRSGAPALVGVDSTVSVDVRRDYSLLDYPVEEGGFETYNKVIRPREIRVAIAISGTGSLLSSIGSGLIALVTGNSPSVAARARTLDALHGLANSLTLVDIRTPEGPYPGYTIEHYDYRREAREGISVIKIDIWLREVRFAAKNAFTTAPPTPAATTPPDQPPPTITAPKDANAAPATNGGAVQASPLSTAQAASLPAGTGGGAPGDGLTAVYDSHGTWIGLERK